VVDYREQEYPLAMLKQLATEKEIQIWCEAEAVQKLFAAGSAAEAHELSACPALAIWTTPPAQRDAGALEQSRPETVYLFGVDPKQRINIRS